MEEAVCTGTDGLVAIYSTWAKYTDRRLVSFHIMSLVARGMAAQKDVLGDIIGIALLDEEGVLHIAGRMVGCKVKHGEHVLVVVNLRSMIEREAHTREDVYDLILDNRKRMAGSQCYRVGCTGQIDVVT